MSASLFEIVIVILVFIGVLLPNYLAVYFMSLFWRAWPIRLVHSTVQQQCHVLCILQWPV